MPLFKYVAFVKSKKEKKIIEAENFDSAKRKLFEKKIVVLTISPFYFDRKNFTISFKELLTFTNEIARLLNAKLLLHDLLFILKDKYHDSKMFPFILDICDQIKRGEKLSYIFSLYPKIFDILYCSMVENAEKSGNLSKTFDEIVSILKKKSKFKKKIISATLYPLILTVFCVTVIFILLFFVIPSLFELFDGKNLHPLTKSVLFISHFCIKIKSWLISFFIFICSLSIFSFFFSNFRKKIYNTIFYFPVVKIFMFKIAIIRFARSFSVLLSSGISYLEALRLSRRTVKNPILEKEIKIAEQKIIEGEKLSQAFKDSSKIPVVITRLLEIAEETAKTSSILYHIAEIYAEELEDKLSRFTALLQPVLLLILGVVVGIIVLSVLLPLTDVASFIE